MEDLVDLFNRGCVIDYALDDEFLQRKQAKIAKMAISLASSSGSSSGSSEGFFDELEKMSINTHFCVDKV